MAVGEAKRQVTAAKGGNSISQVSWTDGVAQDVYYGLEHSFQYSKNINCDDELHGIKLSTFATSTTNFRKCQLISVGDNGVIALDVTGTNPPRWFNENTFGTGGTASTDPVPATNGKTCPGVVFQDYFWYPYKETTNGPILFRAINISGGSSHYSCKPYDHNEATDEDISTPNPQGANMRGAVTAILNYNNTRLVVACGNDIWVYYPELDQNNPVTHPTPGTADNGTTGWKKTLTYEAGVTIVGLTCTFEYLKVWAVDEGWNTQVYYYQGNNDLRNTFVYNLVDLTGVRVIRVYSINGIDYYVSSINGTDGFVNLYKMVGTTPVKLFKQRAGLSPYDANNKAAYFVGPTSLSAAYWDGKFYIADCFGLFQFSYTPNGYDKGYMKWGWYNNEANKQPYGVCKNKDYLYVSTSEKCYMMRIIDTGKAPISGTSGHQPEGVLISREFEGREGGTVTKMLDEIRMNFELNPLIPADRFSEERVEPYGTIEVYVSPNNVWKTAAIGQFTEENGWYRVMRINKSSAGTRTEKSNVFNDLGSRDTSSFKFDWQTITYAIVITRGKEFKTSPSDTYYYSATPIIRQISLRYHCKDKVNNVYDIN